MKKVGLILSVLLTACIAFTACTKSGDQVQKSTGSELIANYQVADQAPEVVTASYDAQETVYQEAEVILTQETAEPEDPEKKFDFSNILNVVLTVLSLVLGGFLAKFKTKLQQVIGLATAVLDAGVEIDKALADNNVSKAEIAAIRARSNTVRDKFKELVSFKKKE